MDPGHCVSSSSLEIGILPQAMKYSHSFVFLCLSNNHEDFTGVQLALDINHVYPV